MVASLAGGGEGQGKAMGSTGFAKELLGCGGFGVRKAEVSGDGGWEHKEATKAEPRWSPATPRGDVALCPAIVQARKWMEWRE